MFLLLLSTFFLALLISFFLTWQVKNAAIRLGLVRGPRSEREVHTFPIPRLGGVALFGALLTSSVLAVLLAHRWSADFGWLDVLRVLLPAAIMTIVGAIDDLRPMGAFQKLFAQVAVATLVFGMGVRVHIPFGPQGSVGAEAISFVATVFWIILLANAFNLVDGLDGLAAGSALFSTITLFAVSLWQQNLPAAMLGIMLAGALVGFLRFNFNPAKIFLGDSGSLFIGFMLASISLLGSQQKSSAIVAITLPVVAFGLPLLETALSIFRRVLNRQSVFTADRQHIHHMLIDRGFSHRTAVLILYAVSGAFGLLSVLLQYRHMWTVVLVVVAVSVWFALQQLGYHEITELNRVARRTVEQKYVIANNLAIRRALQKLQDVRDFEQLCFVLESALAENEFDGFEVLVRGPELHSYRFGESFRIQKNEAHYSWRKESAASVKPAARSWSLNVFCHGNHDTMVQFTFLRDEAAGSILLDLGVITDELSRSLEDAIVKITARSLQRVQHRVQAR